jgi:hypothetical protein
LRKSAGCAKLTFRAAGEGTGRAADLDRFDRTLPAPFPLESRNCRGRRLVPIVGVEVGANGLYTATLFHYGQAFLDKLGPALELGRSWIRAEYQKAFAPLLLLWKGHRPVHSPQSCYTTLFGAVSISNQYQSVSRELMVSFLERNASLRNWAGLIASSNPFRSRHAAHCRSIWRISRKQVSDIEPTGAGVPVAAAPVI